MRNDAPLRSLFERGDPAGDGQDPRPEEIARLRRRVLSAAESRRRELPDLRSLRWVVAATAALGALVLVVRAGDRAAPVDSGPHLATARQVHFQTPGGTRLIWVLRPADGS